MEITGSMWGKWDLQVQTILDSDYISLSSYYEELKASDPQKWSSFISKVGTEEDALLWDKRDYFLNGQGASDLARCANYAKVFFSFLDIYSPDTRCIGITDHNHIHPHLMNALVAESAHHSCKVIPGAELNVEGVHVLVLFPEPPCQQADFSNGIRTFLAQVGVTNINTGGTYTIAEGTVQSLLDKLALQKGICIFAHCNSSNGLFQERGKTDRTVLANVFNHKSPIVLQSRNKSGMNATATYIKSNERLKSDFVETIASDARSLRQIGAPDQDGNYFFVKGLPTLEGLRQAVFEPESRIHIGPYAPPLPVHRIDKIDVEFPSGALIGEDKFCFSGKHSLPLSPNFTCLIGGRGTGKSTILNLVHEKINPNQNKFFSEISIKSDKQKLPIHSCVKLDVGSDGEPIDFLSQNEIEQFATNSQKLTLALYQRLEKQNNGELGVARKKLEDELKKLDAHIGRCIEENSIHYTLLSQAAKRESLLKVVNSFKSADYTRLSGEVAVASQALSSFENSKNNFRELKWATSEIIKEHSSEEVLSAEENSKIRNTYDKTTEEMLVHLRKAEEVSNSVDEDNLDKMHSDLENALDGKQKSLQAYLKSRGLNEENQKDVASANRDISILDEELKNGKKRQEILKKEIQGFSYNSIEAAKKGYESLLRDIIKQVNSGLTNLSDQVKAIELEYRFDEKACLDSIYDEFKKTFAINPAKSGTNDHHLSEAFLKSNPLLLDGKEAMIERLSGGKAKSLTKAEQVVLLAIEDDRQFDLLEMILKKNQLNSSSFKSINVFYDEKPLSRSSFGQRCTAALVLLILLGNNPLIIDEPEGHLDSLLIANYLVDLIKVAKKSRQIIFATHNANLVVNGDADLIYYLEVNEDGITKALPTVLEDLDNRKRIVSLEGGQDAFQKRENKYSLKMIKLET